MRLTGSESEMNRQTIGIHDRVYLAGQTSSRAAHILMIVVRECSDSILGCRRRQRGARSPERTY